jgi:transcriptional regulator with XRE-family HTH domain
VTLPEAIRLCRRHVGLTQQGFASLIGVDRNSVTNYEAGRTSPPAAVLLRMRDVCGVDPYVLAWLSEPSNGEDVMRHLKLLASMT